jgi:hypothetical protein
MELAMTRLRRIVRERVGSETPLSVDELSELPWLEMQDAIDAGLADRADMAQAMFMQDLRPIHPEWSAAELRRWTEGGRWQHTILFGPQFPYCERCHRHLDHGTAGSHRCDICDAGSMAWGAHDA